MPITLWSRLTRWWSPQPRPTNSPSRRPRSERPTSPPEAKQMRAAHREQLFATVRETMIRAGILSGAYKFKALTLDKSGTTFIVMFDIQSPDLPSDPEVLGQLERNLQHLAESRLGITVKAVYWRHANTPPPAVNPATPDPAFAKTRPLVRSADDLYPSPLSDTQMGRME